MYPPGQSQQQIGQGEHRRQFAQSQDNATAAALCELGYPRRLRRVSVDRERRREGQAQGVRPAGQSVDGKPVRPADKLTAVLAKHERRATRSPVGVQALGQADDGHDHPERAGQGQDGRPYRHRGRRRHASRRSRSTSVSATRSAARRPGLMFALGIMDKVGPTDLTKGALHRRNRRRSSPTARSARSAASS